MSKKTSNTGAEQVLVTGGSGFVGSHCILKLLEAGYRVRTTVRSPEREADVRTLLRAGGAVHEDSLSFTTADLMKDAGWTKAVADCDYVLHVASPFPMEKPKHEDDLIVPARDGALRVLKASRDAGVKRVVLTSSFAAIGYGHKQTDQPFSEESWTNLKSNKISAYVKSKTLAEKAAWDFIATDSNSLELSVVNPVGILGPAFGTDLSTSIRIVEQIMTGALPRLPHITFSIVDVRDVADLHLRAMTNPAANGERFLATNGHMSLLEVALLLKARMGDHAKHVSTKLMPDWLVRVASLVNPAAGQIVTELGVARKISNEKSRSVLGWNPRTKEEAVIATAESLVKLGMVHE